MCIDLEPKLCITGQGHILVSSIFWSWFLFPWPNLAQTLPNICRKVRSVTLNKVSMSDIRVIASWRYFDPSTWSYRPAARWYSQPLCKLQTHFPLGHKCLTLHPFSAYWMKNVHATKLSSQRIRSMYFKSPLKCFLI